MTINVEEEIRKRAEKVTQKDMEDLLGKKNMAARLSRKAGFLSQYWDDIKTAFSLIRDWLRGAYDKAPGRMIPLWRVRSSTSFRPSTLSRTAFPDLAFLTTRRSLRRSSSFLRRICRPTACGSTCTRRQ